MSVSRNFLCILSSCHPPFLFPFIFSSPFLSLLPFPLSSHFSRALLSSPPFLPLLPPPLVSSSLSSPLSSPLLPSLLPFFPYSLSLFPSTSLSWSLCNSPPFPTSTSPQGAAVPPCFLRRDPGTRLLLLTHHTAQPLLHHKVPQRYREGDRGSC